MKTTKFYSLLLTSVMLAATSSFTSCSADDNPVAGPTNPEEEDVYEAPEDPLGDFMANFITTNEDGNQVLGGYGQPLDEGDPTVLSIGVESLEEAELLFNSFVTDPLHVVSIGMGNITYSPVSRDGKAQGEIYFNASSDCIAHITFSNDIPQDLVSEVRFIDKKLWPDNATSPYVLGKEYFLMKAYTNTSKTEFRCFLIERDKVTTIDKDSTEPVVILCIDDGSNGNIPLFLRYKYLFNSKDKFTPVSYEHDEVNPNATDDYKYGAWWTETNGKGTVVKYARCSGKNTPDNVLPSLNQLKSVYYRLRNIDELNGNYNINEDGVKTVFTYDKEALDYWWWSQDYNKKGSTFNLYAWNFQTGESDYWRAYTHLGLMCQVIYYEANDNWSTIKDAEHSLRDKDVEYDDEYGIEPYPNKFTVFRKKYSYSYWHFTTYYDNNTGQWCVGIHD